MTSTPAGVQPLDWDALEQETVSLLSEYIRLDTSNPPGNEAIAARWFGEMLRREGIESAYHESAPNRESLIALLPGSEGSGSGGAVMLLNHTDVVPVQAEFWDVAPFDGVVRDGCVWGRGAQDMKGLGILEFMTFVLIKRLNLPHRRDLVFFAIADEEAGGEFGVEWFAKHHPELLKAHVVINEGAGGMTSFSEAGGSDRPVFGFAASEKSPLWLRIKTEGPPGHGSMPHARNALDRLVRALHRVTEWQRPHRIVPEVVPFFEALHAAGVLEPIRDAETAARISQQNALVNALTMDTISLTSCNAGIKVNVIPAVCEATLDCRLLPGRSAEEFIEQLQRQIDDPEVQIERIFSAEGPSSSLDHELVTIIRDVVREHIEEALVVPSVCVGFTDSRTFRRLGVPAYGFSPTLSTEEERRTVHGHNERVQVESLRLGLQILLGVVRRLIE
jgi:acetylornithine deacetylase/succinyl-diaminopimelate desuccinylase-like protein